MCSSDLFRVQVDAPLQVVGGGPVVCGRKARIEVPARVSGIVRVREAHWKSAQAVSGKPSTCSNELVAGGMRQGGIDRFPEWWLCKVSQSNDRTGPGFSIFGIAASCLPQNFAGFGRGRLGEDVFELEEALADKPILLRIAQEGMGGLRFFFTQHRAFLDAGETSCGLLPTLAWRSLSRNV